ncbi:MAG: alpha/beta fold hydrolase [Scytonematopsis contorta HA4267-MV1]|jgi:pimeloyl-ACP methyl ester carboxylesterase|nr:alpha/beta fold hydrolase [Scytonematopsis contorta HA4267-MV1]
MGKSSGLSDRIAFDKSVNISTNSIVGSNSSLRISSSDSNVFHINNYLPNSSSSSAIENANPEKSLSLSSVNYNFYQEPNIPHSNLETAVDWGNVSDRTVSISDTIGFNGNSLDFFRFSVNNRSNINLLLNGFSTDVDFDILDNDGKFIARSTPSITSSESIIRILEAGNYYIKVYPQLPATSTNYNFTLTGINISSIVRPGSKNVNIWRYNKDGRTASPGGTYEGIESNRETVVVIHGWNNNDETPSIYNLAKKASEEGIQVLALDWGSISSANLDWGVVPFKTAQWIAPVARWTKDRLSKLGINPENLSFIGHSLGGYVSSETAYLFNRVKRIVALDPAYPANNYDTDIDTPGTQHPHNFRDVSLKSLAFVVKDGINGLAGDNNRASSADNSFVIDFNRNQKNFLNPVEAHGGVAEIFTDALSRGFMNLTNLNLPNHEKNWYDYNGDKDNFFDRKLNLGQYEGVIYASWVGESGSGKSNWRISGLKQVVDPSGKEEVIWN